MSEIDISTAKTLLGAFARSAGDKIDGVVYHLACEGNVGMLSTILDHGLIASELNVDFRVSHAILPLTESAADKKAGKKLVDEWLKKFGGSLKSQLSRNLCRAQQPAVVRGLLARGANPNATFKFDDEGKRTPISRAIGRKDVASTMLMVDRLLETGEVPLFSDQSSIFVTLAGTFRTVDEMKFTVSVMDELGKRDLPRVWQERIGKALLAATGKSAQFDLDRHLTTGPYHLKMMALARMAEQSKWKELIRRGRHDYDITEGLLDAKDLVETKIQIVRNMVRDGVDVDAPLARCRPGGDPCPLIHAAVFANNVEMVKVLLDLGADPNRKVLTGTSDGPVSAIEVNQQSVESLQAIAAWRAQAAVAAVIKNRIALEVMPTP